MANKDKPLFWMGSSLKDLTAMPVEVKGAIGHAFRLAQQGKKHQDAKPMHGMPGGGVFEMVVDVREGSFRGVYAVQFPLAVYALHCFQKKSKKGIATPQSDVDLIRVRLEMAREHYKKHFGG